MHSTWICLDSVILGYQHARLKHSSNEIEMCLRCRTAERGISDLFPDFGHLLLQSTSKVDQSERMIEYSIRIPETTEIQDSWSVSRFDAHLDRYRMRRMGIPFVYTFRNYSHSVLAKVNLFIFKKDMERKSVFASLDFGKVVQGTIQFLEKCLVHSSHLDLFLLLYVWVKCYDCNRKSSSSIGTLPYFFCILSFS